MQKGSMNFIKGMGAGMIAGAAVVITCKTVLGESNHGITKGSAKIVRAAGDFIDGIQTMFK